VTERRHAVTSHVHRTVTCDGAPRLVSAVVTPAESKPGLAAKAEVALWDLERQEAGDSLAALAPRDILAALEA
jgi:hypothetical protein